MTFPLSHARIEEIRARMRAEIDVSQKLISTSGALVDDARRLCRAKWATLDAGAAPIIGAMDAEERDRLARERDRAAAERDVRGGVRDRAAGRDGPGGESDARREAARDRLDALQDRQAAARDREDAAQERREAERAD